jgi:hypothetical protein
MKWTLYAFSLLALPTVAFADIGIGASFKSNEAGIYVPITITPRILIEPYFRYRDSEDELALAGVAESGVDSSFSSVSVGAGVFGISKLGDAVDFYYGARAAYLREESTSAALIISPIFLPSVPAPTQESDFDGYSIAPTLGFQYYLTDRLSLGAEVRWEFSDVSGTIMSTGSSGSESEIELSQRENSTRTDVLLRFYFR